MHRLMMTSATYRQTSTVTAAHERFDPENALCSRMPMTRMDAESLYDTMLQVAGRLDDTPYGPPVKLEVRPRRVGHARRDREGLAAHDLRAAPAQGGRHAPGEL